MLHEVAEVLDVGRLQVAQVLCVEALRWLVRVSSALVVQHEALARWMSDDTGMLLVRERRVLRTLHADRIVGAGRQITDTVRSAQQGTVGVLRGEPDERWGDVGHFQAYGIGFAVTR